MRPYCPLLLAFFLVVTLTGLCQAQDGISWPSQALEESIQAQLEELELSELLSYADRLEDGYRELLPSLDWRDWLTGKGTAASPGGVVNVLVRSFLRELYLSLELLRQLVVIGLLAALLQRLSMSFGSRMVVDLAFATCFMVLVYLGLESFRLASGVARDAVDNMADFMYSLLPTLSTLLVAVGGVTSATVFHPLLWAMASTMAGLVQRVLLPLILVSTAFSLVSHFSTELSLPKIGGLLRQAVTTILGVMFVVFSGLLVVRGAMAPITDGISLRTAKYLTKTFIPIAGSMFADSLELVVGGSLLIKNAVGIFGLVVILCLAAAPLIKVVVMVFVYKLIGALLQPLCDQRVVKTLETMEGSLILVAIVLGTAALMFFLAVTILVGLGNLAVVMR